MKKYKFLAAAAVILLVTGSAAGCGNQITGSSTVAAESTAEKSADSTVKIEALSFTPGKSDTKTDWDDTAVIIELKDRTAVVTGTGADVSDGTVKITAAGTYVVSGTLTDGEIVVEVPDTDKVQLILNGAEITNKTGSPLYALSGDKLTVTLAEGTQNTLTDSASFEYADAEKEEPDAALFAKCDLTINGTGELTVNASFNNGIGTKDDLVIMSGNFHITAANHGIRGKDSVTVMDGSFDLTVGNDGIQTNNTEEADKGWILLENGSFVIQSVHDGIQADTIITVKGGEYHIVSGGGRALASTSADAVSDTASDSYKGIKSTTGLLISGGTFEIDSADDSIHSNGDMEITDGNFRLTSGDDGIHSDASLHIGGGTIEILESYEGIEASAVTVSDGVITVKADDDGINAAGEDAGGQSKGPSAGDYSVTVTGGTITITTGCDGIDSNGTLDISGGTVISFVNANDPGSGGIDCDGIFTATGGTIIYGGTATGNTPAGSSTQSYLYLGTKVTAGQAVSVRKDGKTLISFDPLLDAQGISFSSPDIQTGDVYEVYADEVLLETVTAGSGGNSGNGMPGGNGSGQMPGGGKNRGNRGEKPEKPIEDLDVSNNGV